MKLIQDVNQIKEDAAGGATGGGAVASFAAPLFKSVVSRKSSMPTVIKPSKKKGRKIAGLRTWFEAKITEAKYAGTPQTPVTFNLMREDAMSGKLSPQNNANLGQDKAKFNSADVFSKLKALDKRGELAQKHNAQTFGLEDENGNIVRVTVSGEQAEEFEKALQQFLSKINDDHTEEGRTRDIGEVLFELKDKFNILNIVWPEVIEDEEEPQEIAGQSGIGDNGEADSGQDMTADDQSDESLPDMGGNAESALQSVIDAMKADAEARKAEADARAAEAKAREADLTTRQTKNKVKKQEEILDMEDFYKAKKDKDKEAKQLAQLAKWKHEMSRSKGDESLADQHGEEHEEEDVDQEWDAPESTISASDIADAVMKRIK